VTINYKKSIFTGEVQDNLPHGKGRLEFDKETVF
jgi:hypothetical protein